ncbi:MAG TPA: alkaline phosphatase family protein [Candidatus Cybelea sp.]|nr:alkaline phosphatase family protein [Candidatus Cybelea sp.]
MTAKPFVALAVLGLIVSAGCFSSGSTPSTPLVFTRTLPQTGTASQYIKHVVVIIQENRSLENFFTGYPGANAPTSGCAIPETGKARPRVQRHVTHRRTTSGCPTGDIPVALQPITFGSKSSPGPDLAHDWESAIIDYDKGKMDGFSNWGLSGKFGPYPAYSYVKQSLIKPYWDIANQYVLADEMFPTEFGGSFTGHLTLVAGTDDISQSPPEAEIDNPTLAPYDCDAPPGTKSSYVTDKRKVEAKKGPYPCFDQWNTIAEVLDNAGVSWKYYATEHLNAGIWEPFEGIQYVRYGPDWENNIIAPQTKILTDPGKGALASVSFVTPSLPDSDHPFGNSDLGPSWVASVVNAIGKSSYWDSTAIVVLWDDWGGWYDNSEPPDLDFRGLGIRVPCLIISPYAKDGYVDHTQYEFASVLKFIEEVYGTGSIGPTSGGYTDQRATSLDAAFDFNQQPRAFTAIPSKYPLSHFLHEPPSNEPVDTQ